MALVKIRNNDTARVIGALRFSTSLICVKSSFKHACTAI